jgi:glyoxylase-like metal-dependent hydrolase (beta-lactamase superfamily II)
MLSSFLRPMPHEAVAARAHAVPLEVQLDVVPVVEGHLDLVAVTGVPLAHVVHRLRRRTPRPSRRCRRAVALDHGVVVGVELLHQQPEVQAGRATADAYDGPEEMARSYGTIVGVDEARVRTTHDGMDLMLGSRRLHFIDTPGHARHHHCIWDETTRGWFTGDTFGISYRDFDVPGRGAWIKPTHPPTQFEPDALRESLARMVAFDPQCVYLTHFGRVPDPRRLARQILQLLDEVIDIGHRQRHAPDRHAVLRDELAALYAASLRAHGVDVTPATMELLSMDVELNAQGLGGWLDRQDRQQARGASA